MIPILLILAITFCLPNQALAWGAGTHLQLGLAVLDTLGSLPPAIAAIIGGAPRDFLYGCIAADIIVGKKFTHYLLHCHRWQIGRSVLQRAQTPSQQACAYGYLAHLAADTIAHNYYVPYKLMKSFPTLALKHAYWEARFDCFVPKEVWDMGHQIARENYRENDALLRGVLADTIFSFGTNKRIFNSILMVSRLDKWQQFQRTINEVSRYPLEDQDREEYLELAREAVFDTLCSPEDCQSYLADPTGERAQAVADRVRKNLRQTHRSPGHHPIRPIEGNPPHQYLGCGQTGQHRRPLN
jgi:Zinc dependent phospholipase C